MKGDEKRRYNNILLEHMTNKRNEAMETTQLFFLCSILISFLHLEHKIIVVLLVCEVLRLGIECFFFKFPHLIAPGWFFFDK